MFPWHRRGDSCHSCRGPSGENLSGGYYEAGGSFLKLGPVASFLVSAFVSSKHDHPQSPSAAISSEITHAVFRCVGFRTIQNADQCRLVVPRYAGIAACLMF